MKTLLTVHFLFLALISLNTAFADNGEYCFQTKVFKGKAKAEIGSEIYPCKEAEEIALKKCNENKEGYENCTTIQIIHSLKKIRRQTVCEAQVQGTRPCKAHLNSN